MANKSGSDLNKFYFTFDYDNGTGELYMRVGTAIFSICAMIDRCLSLIQMVEAVSNDQTIIKDCKITYIVSIISKITSFLFIFLQSFFIFKYANIIINYGKNTALIGLMHIICTNFCVFLRTIVHETVAEIRHHYHAVPDMNHQVKKRFALSSVKIKLNDSVSSTDMNVYQVKQLGCLNTAISFSVNVSTELEQVQDKLTSYLYPCVIEYSLMCMTIFYVLWASIEQRYNPNNHYHPTKWIAENLTKLNSSATNLIENLQQKTRSSFLFTFGINPAMVPNGNNTNIIANNNQNQDYEIEDEEHKYERREVHSYTVDCGKSTTGLFVGIFVLLFTIISLITYFIYRDKNAQFSVQIIEICDIVLITLSFLVCIAIFLKFKFNKFSYKVNEFQYNETLLMVGIAGIYLFGFYTIIAISHNGIESPIESFSLSLQIISIIESTVQSILIIEGLKLYSKDKNMKKTKPGRSLLTLLIIIDVSLWLSETFTLKKYHMNKIQIDYYDIVFWSIVSTVSKIIIII
jgi:hypothetical protein